MLFLANLLINIEDTNSNTRNQEHKKGLC